MEPTDTDARLAQVEAQMQSLEERIPDSNIISPSFWKRLFTVLGYNLVIYFLLLLPATFALGIVAAIAIPKFASTKDKAYAAAMRSDLRNLVIAQESYFADNLEYTASLSALGYRASTGVSGPVVELTADGWTAYAAHSQVSNSCVIYVGSTPIGPATREGEPACTETR